MSYCSLVDAKVAMSRGLLDNIEGAEGAPAKLQQAIERAGSEIDGYLVSGGYDVPLVAVPPNIKNYAVDLAVYNFAVAIGMTDDQAAGELREKAKVAREFLRLVGQGKMRIPTGGANSGDTAGELVGGTHRVQVRRGVRSVDTRRFF